MQDDGALLHRERSGVQAAGDGPEDVVAGIACRRRELVGDPCLDLLDSRNELEQAFEGHRRSQHRGRLERSAQQALGVTVSEPDEATDHRDRYDVSDLGHEVDAPELDCSLHTVEREVNDLRFERRHALRHQLGEHRAPVHRVRGRIRGGQGLHRELTE